MTNIAIVDPHKLIKSFDKHGYVHGYVVDFIKIYRPNIFLSSKFELKLFKEFNIIYDLNYLRQEIIFSISELNKKNDILIYFWGFQSNFIIKDRIKKIFKSFNGIKFYHVQDYQYMSSTCHQYLIDSKIDYLLGYSKHSLHCEFFRKFYSKYFNKIIGVPFGYSPKFFEYNDFHKRKKKAVGSGAIEKFDWKDNKKYWKKTSEYYAFFSKKNNSMHELRYLIYQNNNLLKNLIDCKFNIKSEKYNYIKDYNKLFNDYMFFVNDESLLNFPPIRTYEGCAAGSIMICNNSSCYEEIGFIDNQNCIMFEKNNLNDLRDKIRYYVNNPTLTLKIREKSLNHVKNFTHKNIAIGLYNKIIEKYNVR